MKLRHMITEEQKYQRQQRWSRYQDHMEKRMRQRVQKLADDSDMDATTTQQVQDMLAVEIADVSDLFRKARKGGDWQGLRDKIGQVRQETDAQAQALPRARAVREIPADAAGGFPTFAATARSTAPRPAMTASTTPAMAAATPTVPKPTFAATARSTEPKSATMGSTTAALEAATDCSGNIWHIQTVDSAGDVGNHDSPGVGRFGPSSHQLHRRHELRPQLRPMDGQQLGYPDRRFSCGHGLHIACAGRSGPSSHQLLRAYEPRP